MVLSDFLSRQKVDDSNPHKIIPISFTLRSQADNHFYQINNEIYWPKTDEYLVQTRSQARSSSFKILEIHGGKVYIHMLSWENKDHYHHYLHIVYNPHC